MQSDEPSERAAVEELRALLTKTALHHFDEINLRTATIMRGRGVLAKEVELAPLPGLLEQLDAVSLESEQRPGPLLVTFTEPNVQTLTDLRDLVLSPTEGTRTRVVDFFAALAERYSRVLGPWARQGVNRGAILSPDWHEPAVALHDALHEDFVLNVGSLWQCLNAGALDLAERFLLRVLEPSRRAWDFEQLPTKAASRDQATLRDVAAAICSDSDSWSLAVERLCERLGYLPLSPRLAVGALAAEWQQKTGEAPTEAAWRAAWSWAYSQSTPLPSFTLLMFLLGDPGLLACLDADEVAVELAEAVRPSDSRRGVSWTLRRGLARHYARYLEARHPGGDGEEVANAALWLADAVATFFEALPAGLFKCVLTETVKPTEEESFRVAYFSASPLRPCALLHAIHLKDSVWRLCVLSALEKSVAWIAGSASSCDWLREDLAHTILSSLPLREADDPVYAFEAGVRGSAAAWAEATEDEELTKLAAVEEPASWLDSEGEFAKALRESLESEPGVQAVVLAALRSMASLNRGPIDGVWEVVSDDDWRSRALLEWELNLVQLLGEALLLVQAHRDGQWHSHLPHLFALAFAEATGDRRELLFGFAVLASIRAGSTSAVERMLSGPDRANRLELAKHWLGILRGMQHLAPRWVYARLRPFFLCLGEVGDAPTVNRSGQG